MPAAPFERQWWVANMADKIALCLFVGLFPFAGSLVIAMWLLAVTRGARSRSWPVVEGRVQSSWAETKSEITDEGSRVTVHRPHIRYTYAVGRTDYSCERIDFNVGENYTCRSRDSAERIVGSYHYGDRISIHYNPKNPQQSVLKAGVVTDTGFYLAPILGTIYYGGGLLLATLWHGALMWAVIIGASCLGAAVGLDRLKKPRRRRPRHDPGRGPDSLQ